MFEEYRCNSDTITQRWFEWMQMIRVSTDDSSEYRWFEWIQMIRVNKIRLFFLRRVREKIVRDRERRSITRAIYRPTDRRTRRWCAWKPKMSLVFGWERVRRVNELTFIQWAMRKMEIEGKEFCTVIFFMCVFAMEKHWGWNIQLAIYNRPTDGWGGVHKQTEMLCFWVMKEHKVKFAFSVRRKRMKITGWFDVTCW